MREVKEEASEKGLRKWHKRYKFSFIRLNLKVE